MDKSTGKQVTTIASGNLLGVELSEPSDEVARELKDKVDRGERDLLTDATCFATTTMMHETYLEYLTGTETRYIVKIENVTWPGIVIDGLVTYEPFEDDQGVACNLYRNVMVVSQPDVVYQVECCGTEEGNCCVNADQAQGQRRLKGCVESCSVSDIRLKKDINRLGESPSGIPVYSFKYREDMKDVLQDEDTTSVYFGAMAQDLLELAPEAVGVGSNGYYAVDYSKIDVDFLKLV